MRYLAFCLLWIWLAYLPAASWANMQINEISPSSNPEWVELFNNGSEDVDLTGWRLVDSSNKAVVLSGVVPGNSLVVFEHSTGWLNNSIQSGQNYADILTLFDNASPSAIIDRVEFGTIDSEESVARLPDGQDLVYGTDQTKGTANPQPPVTATPTPTNDPATPSPTPSPTSSPVLISQLTPTPTVSLVKPTAIIASSKLPAKPTASVSGQPLSSTSGSQVSRGIVLGTEVEVPAAEAMAGSEETTQNWPRLFGWVAIVIGLGLMGLSVTLVFHRFNANREV